MKGRLSDIQIEYVLEHLGHHANLGEDLCSLIRYGENPVPGATSIIFPASEDELDLDRVIRIDDLPVLYPVANVNDSFWEIRDNNLQFHHDLLKSIFHLLSGFEEVKNGARDQYGRFPYEESLQCKMGIMTKPLVNYYFEIILDAIELFSTRSGFNFNRRPVFENPVLMLSHDIDRLDAYSFFETAFKFKQLLGFAESPFKLSGRLREAFSALYYFLNPFSRRNPFWSFERMMEWESERGFRSTYYFLEKEGGRHANSRYHFHEKRIGKLLVDLSSNGHEIGIHGTIQSATQQAAMKRTVKHLQDVAPEPVVGIRQHFLKVHPGVTAQIQEKAGLKYDASMGFAERDGFRNSYCWPFRLYDFNENRPLEIWEIPLIVMEGTHFYYRKLDLASGRASIEELASEVVKFNGIFSILWHNHFFDEREFPGVTDHYLGILDHFRSLDMKGITGREILERIRSAGASDNN